MNKVNSGDKFTEFVRSGDRQPRDGYDGDIWGYVYLVHRYKCYTKYVSQEELGRR